MLQTKVIEKIKSFMFDHSPLLPPQNRNVYEIMWKKYSRPQMATWRRRLACRIPKATNTYSE
jgi:hypothetical protein